MSETTLKIRVLGDPVLRKRARRIITVTAEHRRILSQMSRIMYDSSGVGLAATQVGINESMIVVDIGSGLYKLINPRILKREGQQEIEEGCLSVPGVTVRVKRSKKVLIEAQDEDSKPLSIEANDLLACVFQHEIDHLQGKLIVDYASIVKKLTISTRLKRVKVNNKNEGLSEPERKSQRL